MCIRNLIIFQDKSVLDLFDLENGVNIIYPTFTKKFDLHRVRSTNIKAQKIDGNILDTYEIVVVAFSITD